MSGKTRVDAMPGSFDPGLRPAVQAVDSDGRSRVARVGQQFIVMPAFRERLFDQNHRVQHYRQPSTCRWNLQAMKPGEFVHAWRSHPGNTPVTSFLLLLLAIDFVFFFLHFLPLFGVLNNPLFSLEEDGGYPERYQYVKIFSIVALLVAVSAKAKVIGYGAWAVLFLYLLLDDALSIHESLGLHVATNFGFLPAFGLRARDFGELVVTAIAATLLLVPLAMFYFRGTTAFKGVSRCFFLLLVALAFFGVIVDMLHVVVDQGWKVSFLLGAVEDGGEMIVMTLMAAYAFLLYRRDGAIGHILRPAA